MIYPILTDKDMSGLMETSSPASFLMKWCCRGHWGHWGSWCQGNLSVSASCHSQQKRRKNTWKFACLYIILKGVQSKYFIKNGCSAENFRFLGFLNHPQTKSSLNISICQGKLKHVCLRTPCIPGTVFSSNLLWHEYYNNFQTSAVGFYKWMICVVASVRLWNFFDGGSYWIRFLAKYQQI